MIRAIEPAELQRHQRQAADLAAHTQEPLQLVDMHQLERMAYTDGWRWGFFCGACCALAAATAGAVLLGILA